MEGRPRGLLYPLAIAALATAVYLNSLPNGFTWDDAPGITENYLIQDLRHLPRLFVTDLFEAGGGETGAYRPIFTASLALNWAVSGPEPWAFRAVNAALHAGASVLVFLVLRRLLGGAGRVPFLAALLFAAHPIHADAVSMVWGRGDPLAACFLLGGWLVYLRGGRGALPIALGLYLLALLSKEVAAVFPFLIALGGLYRREPARRVARDFLITWCVFLLYLPIRLHALGGFGPADEHTLLRGMGLLRRMEVMLPVFREYILVSLFPVKLSPDYKFIIRPGYFTSAEVVSGIVLVIAILGLAGAGWRSRSPLSLAILLFLIPLIPVSNVIPSGEVMGERVLYLSSIGGCLALALLAARRSPRPVAWAAVGIAVCLCSVLTVSRNRVMADQATLARYTLHHYPESYFSRMDLGVAAYRDGDLEKAVRIFREVLTIYPDHEQTIENLAKVLADLGLLRLQAGAHREALRSFEEALRLRPGMRGVRINRGTVLLEMGRPSEAEEIFREIRSEDPEYAPVIFQHARALEMLERREESGRAYGHFLRVYDGPDESLREYARERAASSADKGAR